MTTPKKGHPTASVDLAGKRYSIRYDVQAMIEIETNCSLLSIGMGRDNFQGLLDPPYNTRELVILLATGIAGAKRFEGGEKIKADLDAARTLLQDHYDYLGRTAKDLEAWKKSRDNLMQQLSTAARLGAGLKLPGEPEEPEPGQTGA